MLDADAKLPEEDGAEDPKRRWPSLGAKAVQVSETYAAMWLLQFDNSIDMFQKQLQGWKIRGGIGQVRVGAGVETRDRWIFRCQLQCRMLLFQARPGLLLVSLLYELQDCNSATEYSSGYSFVQIQAGLSALEDAMKAGYEDFKVTKQHLFCKSKNIHAWFIVSDIYLTGFPEDYSHWSGSSELEEVRGFCPTAKQVRWIVYQWERHQCHQIFVWIRKEVMMIGDVAISTWSCGLHNWPCSPVFLALPLVQNNSFSLLLVRLGRYLQERF